MVVNETVIIIGGGPAGASCAVQLKRYGIDALLIEKMEGQPDGDSDYRLDPTDPDDQRILQYFTLRTGLYDGADNDGDLIVRPIPNTTVTRIVRTPSDSLEVPFNWWLKAVASESRILL